MKNLPDDFVSYTRKVMGEERFSRFLLSMDELPPVSLRVNRMKNSVSVPCADIVSGADDKPNVNAEVVPWCPDGYYLSERPSFTFDPLLHAGHYYVQEASSMFVDRVLRQYVDGKIVMLDMCAAPGGKSTAALGALPEGSVLVSNEPVRSRANILAENLTKWGSPCTMVTNAYPADIARSGMMFDVVLCDVPCSGEGMFRKDDGAIAEWSVQNIDHCSKLQRDIVAEAWKVLRPGGLLIYSTCTFNLHEDEDNIAHFISQYGAEPLSVDVCDEWNITSSLLDGFDVPVYRFIPGISRGEGLFLAVLRKSGEAVDYLRKTRKKPRLRNVKRSDVLQRVAKVSDKWLSSVTDFVFAENGAAIVAMPYTLEPLFRCAVDAKIRIVKAGVAVAVEKGKDLIPDIELALSSVLAHDAFACHDVDLDTALAYLRKEAITLPPDAPRGFVLVTFKGAPLGFVKNIGNRANNLYPQEWRILRHVPKMNPFLPDS